MRCPSGVLTDALVSYVARGLTGSKAKERIVELIRERSDLSLARNTLPSAVKVNICYWQPNRRDFDVL